MAIEPIDLLFVPSVSLHLEPKSRSVASRHRHD